MTSPQTVDLTAVEAAALLHEELTRASEALHNGSMDAILDGYVCALGLALQLGPAPTERVLTNILDTARQLAHRHDAPGLSALGPALVALVNQVREAGALPSTTIMQAWATVTADLGTLIGQVGLALTIAPDRRESMINNARTRAALLDDATNNLFALVAWLDEIPLDF